MVKFRTLQSKMDNESILTWICLWPVGEGGWSKRCATKNRQHLRHLSRAPQCQIIRLHIVLRAGIPRVHFSNRRISTVEDRRQRSTSRERPRVWHVDVRLVFEEHTNTRRIVRKLLLKLVKRADRAESPSWPGLYPRRRLTEAGSRRTQSRLVTVVEWVFVELAHTSPSRFEYTCTDSSASLVAGKSEWTATHFLGRQEGRVERVVPHALLVFWKKYPWFSELRRNLTCLFENTLRVPANVPDDVFVRQSLDSKNLITRFVVFSQNNSVIPV